MFVSKFSNLHNINVLVHWLFGTPEQNGANNHAADKNKIFFEISAAFKFCVSSSIFGFIG